MKGSLQIKHSLLFLKNCRRFSGQCVISQIRSAWDDVYLHLRALNTELSIWGFSHLRFQFRKPKVERVPVLVVCTAVRLDDKNNKNCFHKNRVLFQKCKGWNLSSNMVTMQATNSLRSTDFYLQLFSCLKQQLYKSYLKKNASFVFIIK